MISPSAGRLAQSLAIFVSVLLFSFLLARLAGLEATNVLLGENPSPQQIQEYRQARGYEDPIIRQFVRFVTSVIQFDFGVSEITGKPASSAVGRALVISAIAIFPAYLAGSLLAFVIASIAACWPTRWPDTLVRALTTISMSLSLVLVAILGQTMLCSSMGAGLCAVQGWRWDTGSELMYHAFGPWMVIGFAALGYNGRFFRSVLMEQTDREYVRTARTLGFSRWQILYAEILPNAIVPCAVRILFAIPAVLVSGSLVVENQFAIPGMGRLVYDSIQRGDDVTLTAIIATSALLFALFYLISRPLFNRLDPQARSRV